MYFKHIEMRGFKSFVDETKFTFERGVTAIVGPNGCGKSNVADAIRWVLGEQSAKLMRGAKMEDFIFNGSSTRKPSGFAEVSITISNDDGAISTAPYAEYEEITVTRKLFRSGESEYQINRVSCRLKDIVDIFLDTGVSTRSLTIIEQDQVNRIVNSKPEERRFLIEEAAGVMKYKHRRNAALNKLSSSQQNLLRIQDILGELERQRNSLKRQAKKAERFKTYRTEIKDQALFHFAAEYQRLAAKLHEVKTGLKNAEEKETASSAQLAAKRNERETIESALTLAERQISEIKEERYNLNATIEKNEHSADLFSRQIEELAAAETSSREEKNRLVEELAQVKEALNKREMEIETLAESIGRGSEKKATLQEDMEQERAQLAEHEVRLNDAILNEERIASSIATRQTSMADLKARSEMAQTRLVTLIGKAKELTATIHSLEAKQTIATEELSREKEQLNLTQNQSDVNKEKLETLTGALAKAEREAKGVSEEKTRLESRLESLEELTRNREGYGEGVKNLYSFQREGKEGALGITGLLADLLIIPAEYEKAVVSLLGERLEAIVTTNTNETSAAVDLLKSENAGRATFIASDLLPDAKKQAEPDFHPSLIGLLKDSIGVDEKAPANVTLLMAGSWLVKDLASAIEIWKKRPGAFTLVTLDGEVIDENGLITGGAGSTGPAAIVARKRIIVKLAFDTTDARIKDETAIDKIAAISANADEAKQKLGASENALRSIEMGVIERSNNVKREQDESARAKNELAQVVAEQEETGKEKEQATAGRSSLQDEITELEQEREEIKKGSATSKEEIATLKSALDNVSSRLRQEEVSLTKLLGKQENANLDIRRLASNRTDLTERIEKLSKVSVDATKRAGSMATTIESLTKDNVELAREKDLLSEQITLSSERLDESRQGRESLDTAIKELTGEVDNHKAGLADLALKKTEYEMHTQNAIEKADHEFNIPQQDLEEADLTEIDLTEADRRLAHLRQELGRIGDVNMSALEEFEDLDTRYQHMKTQRDDLVVSIANLRKTIDSINQTTNRMFNEAFREVSANFEKVFKRLFGGGKAEMLLVQEEGKPEPGVEILVTPPGKKVRNLNLLSAGEKAMTAIALLFAVFLKQPSPFCLLDEIDAPLDEANIFRFRDMLMEMKEKTQFVIITHSQKTMSFAERLYGVTQEEDGVSKILAVDLVAQRGQRAEDFSVSAA